MADKEIAWIVTQTRFLRHCAQVMGGVIDGCDPGPEQDRQYYGGYALEELKRCREHLLEEVLNTDGPAAHCDMRDALSELVALVRGECPRLLDEDSGGDVRLSMRIDELLAPIEDVENDH